MEKYKNVFWFRAWARLCDYCLLFLLLGVISLFLPLFYDPFFYLFMALCIPLLWAPLEAFAISKWGTTLGKKLFGISVKAVSGVPLTYTQALKRAFFLPSRPGTIFHKKISSLRTICAIALTLGSLSFGLFGNWLTQWGTGIQQGVVAESWIKFESEKADFEVYFPSDPEEKSKQLIIPSTGKVLEYEEITSQEEKDIAYTVTHMTIPNKWKLAGNATLLKLSLEAIVKHSPETTLIHKQFVMHQGHRALDYKLKEGKNEIKGRLIVIGNTLYKLSILYPPHQADVLADSPFLDSFTPS